MTFYDWLATNPELVPLYAAVVLVLLGWTYASFRKLWKWYVSISAALGERWGRDSPLPPDDVTGDILGFCVVTAINLVLIGGYIYLVT